MIESKGWTQLEFEQWYNQFSLAEWDRFLQYAELNRFKAFDLSILRAMVNHSGRKYPPSWKQIKLAMSIVDSIEMGQQRELSDQNFLHSVDTQEVRNLTIRVAWHDNGWDGRVCRNPEGNTYCTGHHSLLSERLRTRKRTDIETQFAGQPVTDLIKQGNYLPPCFWSINLAGEKDIPIEHDNPAAPKLDHIKETLPAHSVFSWPFALSFTRGKDEKRTDGSYPKNLKEVRIPRFQSRLKPEETVVILYANYDNPISGDQQQYLIIGCGLLKGKGSTTEYSHPKEELEKKRRVPDYRNFPDTNWALRYTLESSANFVMMPYHEYLAEAETNGNFERLNEIAVVVSEAELIQCFKYVAMDIDDDEALFILSKIRQKLLVAKDHGVVSSAAIQNNLERVDDLSSQLWRRRGYFPGFARLAKAIMGRNDEPLRLSELVETLKKDAGDEYPEKLTLLLENPRREVAYKHFLGELLDLREALRDNYGIEVEDFLRLAMMNLTLFQFRRILDGDLSEGKHRDLKDVCANLYILVEEYESTDDPIDRATGERKDIAIPLFKVDAAYFPQSRFLERIDLQREMRIADQRRVRALVIQHLWSLESFGHCFNESQRIEASLREYPFFYKSNEEYILPPGFLYDLNDLVESHLAEKLHIEESGDKKYLYLKSLYEAEQYISSKIKFLLARENHDAKMKGKKAYLERSATILTERMGKRFDRPLFVQERERLYENVFSKSLFVLAGAPGSGKSYELLNVVKHLKSRGESCLVLAPTGKAVTRLGNDPEFDNIDARTIDRFLVDVEHGRDSAEQYSNIIVDEMSMIDLLKFEELLKALNVKRPSFKRLILVGDQYQLPPIGFGKVYIDTIKYLQLSPEWSDNWIELESNLRQESDDAILDLARIFSLQNIEYEDVLSKLEQSPMSQYLNISFWDSRQRLHDLIEAGIRGLVAEEGTLPAVALNRKFGLTDTGEIRKGKKGHRYSVDAFQIISPYRTGAGGSTGLNQFIHERLKGVASYLPKASFPFKHSDKVMETVNKYDRHELYLPNGSMGFAQDEAGHARFYFPENGPDPLEKNDLSKDSLELAYCITVHKSQGSGFDDVFLVIPKRLTLLSRELMYTALSRSRSRLHLFVEGEERDLDILRRVRLRSYTETRQTSLLGLPFWEYSLEPEPGVFVQSRVEYIIYRNLLETKNKVEGFTFTYERHPVVNGKTLRPRTDFIVTTESGKVYYWEHLGKLGSAHYERTWKIKRRTYSDGGIIDQVVTTDEIRGISESKIRDIIQLMRAGEIGNEDKHHRWSSHHFSLR